MAFEQDHPEIATTKLWQIFIKKAKSEGLGSDFIAAVGKVCANGLDLSRTVIRFFPNFTLHDGLHSANVCRWMHTLLGTRANKLTAHEAALLLLAACWHDVGMSVSDEQKQEMLKPTYPGWDEYFEVHTDDCDEFLEKNVISEKMLRNFVRLHHHERIDDNLCISSWPDELTINGLAQEDLLTVCRSHGTELSRDELPCRDNYDLLMCAVLLRLADLLDYDAARAPDVLYQHLGLDQPADQEMAHSAVEHQKLQKGKFNQKISNGIVSYNASFNTLQQEQDIRAYLTWVEQEMEHCAENLCQTASQWKDLHLPYKVSTKQVHRKGYGFGEFCMTMDQDKIINLLAGQKIYSDPGVFVRELLQNAIDAVLMRTRQDPNFTLEQGKIVIDTWPDGNGNTWFRIQDNGIGMDEHIILNYFLKVGRSYYSSDEFRMANRRAPSGRPYTAISRFGIGTLSCFMSDPDHTQLKVSTKHFQPGNKKTSDKNGIRLDVTGLHGYYYFAHESQHKVTDTSFLKMPSPNQEDRGYRKEPGTTICVLTNLFRLGKLQSFRDILDKYVQFPEVRVEYHTPEETWVYPTQQDLMNTIYRLNAGMDNLKVAKEHIYPIPNEHFERLKQTFPGVRWEQKPAVVLRYHPLNWLSDSNKMTGVAVHLSLICQTDCTELLEQYTKATPRSKVSEQPAHWLDVEWCLSLEKCSSLSLSFELQAVNFDLSAGNDPSQPAVVAFHFPLIGPDSLLSHEEQKIFSYLQNALKHTDESQNLIAYNGVLASWQGLRGQEDPLFARVWEADRAIMLLREDFLPDVDLARNEIMQLPPEASCCCAKVCSGIPTLRAGFLSADPIRLLTTRELWEILDRHPVWEDNLGSSDFLDIYGSLDSRLRIASHERKTAYSYQFAQDNIYGRMLVATNKPVDDDTIDFPVGMFAWPQHDNSPLAELDVHNIYNRMHPFSQWLIQHRKALADQMPAIYDTLIRAMVLGKDGEQIRDTLNAILTRLQGISQNCFGIHDGLFLTTDDFV